MALRATRDVIVDLSELNFADSSLMIDLACLAQRLRARDRTLSLCHPQPHVRRLIELVGLHRLPSVLVIVPQAASAPTERRSRLPGGRGTAGARSARRAFSRA